MPGPGLLNDVHQMETMFVDELRYDLFAVVADQFKIPVEDMRAGTSIIHYVGEKPWQSGNHLHYPHEIVWWEYAKGTIFFHQFLENFLGWLTAPGDYYGILHTLEYNNRKNLHELGMIINKISMITASLQGKDMREIQPESEFGEVLDMDHYFPPAEWTFLPYDEAKRLLSLGCPEEETYRFIQNYLQDDSMKKYIEMVMKTNEEIQSAYQLAMEQLAKLQENL